MMTTAMMMMMIPMLTNDFLCQIVVSMMNIVE